MLPHPALVPSLDLVHRITAVVAAYTVARMRILERIPGNPIGIAVRPVDTAVALMARHLPSLPFNTVVGLRAGQAAEIAPLVEWYNEHKALPAGSNSLPATMTRRSPGNCNVTASPPRARMRR